MKYYGQFIPEMQAWFDTAIGDITTQVQAVCDPLGDKEVWCQRFFIDLDEGEGTPKTSTFIKNATTIAPSILAGCSVNIERTLSVRLTNENGLPATNGEQKLSLGWYWSLGGSSGWFGVEYSLDHTADYLKLKGFWNGLTAELSCGAHSWEKWYFVKLQAAIGFDGTYYYIYPRISVTMDGGTYDLFSEINTNEVVLKGTSLASILPNFKMFASSLYPTQSTADQYVFVWLQGVEV